MEKSAKLNEEQARMMEFLKESALFYGNPSAQNGYNRACKEMLSKAFKHDLLTMHDLQECADGISKEFLKSQPQPNKAADWVQCEDILESMHTALINADEELDDFSIILTIADHFQKFMALNAYGDGTLCLGLILANYMAAWYGLPLFVFKAQEKDQLLNTLKDHKRLSSYFMEKRREAFYGPGRRLMLAESSDSLNTIYKDAKGRKLIVHWNAKGNDER